MRLTPVLTQRKVGQAEEGLLVPRVRLEVLLVGMLVLLENMGAEVEVEQLLVREIVITQRGEQMVGGKISLV